MRFWALLSRSVPCTHKVGKPSFSCIAGALHVRAVAKLYGVPVILHTDHAQKSWLPWIDGLMEANEEYFKQHGEPLFSSHMLDLSEEPLEENIAICKKYLERMAKVNVALEFGAVVCARVWGGVLLSHLCTDTCTLHLLARAHAHASLPLPSQQTSSLKLDLHSTTLVCLATLQSLA